MKDISTRSVGEDSFPRSSEYLSVRALQMSMIRDSMSPSPRKVGRRSVPWAEKRQVWRWPSAVTLILEQAPQNGFEMDSMKPIVPVPSVQDHRCATSVAAILPIGLSCPSSVNHVLIIAPVMT